MPAREWPLDGPGWRFSIHDAWRHVEVDELPAEAQPYVDWDEAEDWDTAPLRPVLRAVGSVWDDPTDPTEQRMAGLAEPIPPKG